MRPPPKERGDFFLRSLCFATPRGTPPVGSGPSVARSVHAPRTRPRDAALTTLHLVKEPIRRDNNTALTSGAPTIACDDHRSVRLRAVPRLPPLLSVCPWGRDRCPVTRASEAYRFNRCLSTPRPGFPARPDRLAAPRRRQHRGVYPARAALSRVARDRSPRPVVAPGAGRPPPSPGRRGAAPSHPTRSARAPRAPSRRRGG